MFSLRRKTFVAWIALVAVLYAAATPVLAALGSQAQPGILAEICTMAGIKPAADQPAVPAENWAQHQQHCVFCISGAWQPPVNASPVVPAPAASGTLVLAGSQRILLHASPLLQPLGPRAPPRLV